jgi:hypothetical protein
MGTTAERIHTGMGMVGQRASCAELGNEAYVLA